MLRSSYLGNGCKLYNDCFSCPLSDCVWDEGMNEYKQVRLIRIYSSIIAEVSEMIEVCVDTIWEGMVAVRQQYIEEAMLYSQGIVVCHGKDKMKIRLSEIEDSIVRVSQNKVLDKYHKHPPGRLYYFRWKPDIKQEVLL